MPAPLVTLGIGAVVAYAKARRHLTLVVDPDRADPSRHFWVFKVAILLVLVAITWWSITAAAPQLGSLLPGLVIVPHHGPSPGELLAGRAVAGEVARKRVRQVHRPFASGFGFLEIPSGSYSVG